MAGNEEQARIKLMVAGLEVIGQVLKAPALSRPLRYEPETQLDLDREYREWLRSARSADSDWEVSHA